MSHATLYCGDVRSVLATLPECSVQCVVTSPPYWGLRDYGMSGQLGLERTPEEYVANMVQVFEGVRRVLKEDGVLWLNLGDSYASAFACDRRSVVGQGSPDSGMKRPNRLVGGLKEKDLVGIPWLVAFALRADGWYLRSEVIWSKTVVMPESVLDRPTKAHEHVFLLTKRSRYFYNADAIREPDAGQDHPRHVVKPLHRGQPGSPHTGIRTAEGRNGEGRNARSVWTIPTTPYAAAHFATFPEELARRCIMAGSKPGDTVLDPFGGSGTVAQVATGNGRESSYIDLNPAYLELAKQRIGALLCETA